MESSSQNKELLYDPIRKKWVAKTPEEEIRQQLLKQMIEKLGYPASLIAVEKELSALPHLRLTPLKDIPKRRADLLVFSKDAREGSLFPLLLVECKAVALTPEFARQVLGYNTFIGAPFVALANRHQILTGSYDADAGQYRFETGMRHFNDLYS